MIPSGDGAVTPPAVGLAGRAPTRLAAKYRAARPSRGGT